MPGFWQQTCSEPCLGARLVLCHGFSSSFSAGDKAPSRNVPALPEVIQASLFIRAYEREVSNSPDSSTGVYQVTKPYSSHRVLRHNAQPLPVASSSKGPQAPMVQQGGNKALLLVTSPAAEGRCHGALLPITGSQAPQRHSKVREHLFCSPCTFVPPLVTMSITDFTQPAPHLLLWCYLPGSSSIMYSLALPAFTLSHLSLSTEDLGPCSAETWWICSSSDLVLTCGSLEHYLLLQPLLSHPLTRLPYFPLIPAVTPPSSVCS